MRSNDQVALPGHPLALTALGMGCAVIGGLYQRTSEAQARAAIDEAWRLGVRYFDTAPYYGFTLSEHRLGAALRDHARDEFVISTKVGRRMLPDSSVKPGECDWASPLPFRPVFDYTYDGVLRSHQDSLQRLGLSRIDILFVHDIGVHTHADRHAHYWAQLTAGGGFRALEQLRSEGQVRAIGLGVNETGVIQDCINEIALDCTLLAGRYTLLEQDSLNLLNQCARAGQAIVVGGPFNSGILAGGRMFNYREAPPELLRRVERMEAVCARFEVPLAAAALQFPLGHAAVISCIPGGRDVDQLRQNSTWFEMPLPAELWGALKHEGLLNEDAPVPLVQEGS